MNILALFPLAWKPDARHRSLAGTELESGYFSVEDTARLMQGFVPERSFTSATPTRSTALMEIMPRLKEHKQPEAAQNAA